MQRWQWLMAVLCVRYLNNTKKDKKMRCVASHLFLGTGQLLCPITAHEAPSPWTNRSRAHFNTAEDDGEGPVCILSGLWWSHWLWEVSGMRSMDSDGDSELRGEEGRTKKTHPHPRYTIPHNCGHFDHSYRRLQMGCESYKWSRIKQHNDAWINRFMIIQHSVNTDVCLCGSLNKIK